MNPNQRTSRLIQRRVTSQFKFGLPSPPWMAYIVMQKIKPMKSLANLIVILSLAVGRGFAEGEAPKDPDNGEDLVVSEITISRGPVQGGEEEGFPATASYRVIARITNKSKVIEINPVFHVSLDSSPDKVEGCASSMILMPLETRVFCSGGLHTSPENLANAKTAIIRPTKNPFPISGWDDKIKNVPKLGFVDVVHRKFPLNQFVTVTATFQNPEGIALSRVMGTAVFLDKDGRVTDAGPVDYDVQNPRKDGMFIGFHMSNVKESDQCIIEVNDFER